MQASFSVVRIPREYKEISLEATGEIISMAFLVLKQPANSLLEMECELDL